MRILRDAFMLEFHTPNFVLGKGGADAVQCGWYSRAGTYLYQE
jgi:hypothetical protein